MCLLTLSACLLQVYIICGATLFVPILLETIARENGQLAPEYTSPCPASSQIDTGEEVVRCAVKLLGHRVDTGESWDIVASR